MVKAAVIRV